MLNVKEAKADVGVIVGRFQVHQPHEAHIILIESVLAKHDKVLIFLGLSSLRNTFNNPLDYRSRQSMLRDHFGNKLEIHYIDDVPSDKLWSSNLDEQIQKWTNPNQSVLLYGSRDSFLERYTGKRQTRELESPELISGTEIRRKVMNDYPPTEAFRAGMIAATGQRFPTVYTTVDIAVLNGSNDQVLLCKKPNESKWRFIGGFADTGSDDFEADARREVAEEANIEVDGFEYIGSAKIDDWRYASEIDCIKTIFYKALYIFGRPEGGDDVAYVKWFPVSELEKNKEIVVLEHQVLVMMLLTNLERA